MRQPVNIIRLRQAHVTFRPPHRLPAADPHRHGHGRHWWLLACEQPHPAGPHPPVLIKGVPAAGESVAYIALPRKDHRALNPVVADMCAQLGGSERRLDRFLKPGHEGRECLLRLTLAVGIEITAVN